MLLSLCSTSTAHGGAGEGPTATGTRRARVADDARKRASAPVCSLPTLRTISGEVHALRASLAGDDAAAAAATAQIFQRHALTMRYCNGDVEASFCRYYYHDLKTPMIVCAILAVYASVTVAVQIFQSRTRSLHVPTLCAALLKIAVHGVLTGYFFISHRRNQNQGSNDTKQTSGDDAAASSMDMAGSSRIVVPDSLAALPAPTGAQMVDSSSASSPASVASVSAMGLSLMIREILGVALVAVMLLYFYAMYFGKVPQYCLDNDPHQCAQFIQADGNICFVHLLSVGALRLRFVVSSVALTTLITGYFVLRELPVSPATAPSFRAVSALMIGALTVITVAAMRLNEMAARHHFEELFMLEKKRRISKQVAEYFASVTSTMIPEPVARRIARGEGVHDAMEDVMVCCVGLDGLLRLVQVLGPAQMVMALQVCTLCIDAALAALHDHSIKFHAFGDRALVCLKHRLHAPKPLDALSKPATHRLTFLHTLAFLNCIVEAYYAHDRRQADPSVRQAPLLRVACAFGNVHAAAFAHVKNFVVVGGPVNDVVRLRRLMDGRNAVLPPHSNQMTWIAVTQQVLRQFQGLPAGARGASTQSAMVVDLVAALAHVRLDTDEVERSSRDTAATARKVLVIPANLLGDAASAMAPDGSTTESTVTPTTCVSTASGNAFSDSSDLTLGVSAKEEVPSNPLVVGGDCTGQTKDEDARGSANERVASAEDRGSLELERVWSSYIPIYRFTSLVTEASFQAWKVHAGRERMLSSFTSGFVVGATLCLSCVVSDLQNDLPMLLAIGASVTAAVGCGTSYFFAAAPQAMVLSLEVVFCGFYIAVFATVPQWSVLSTGLQLWVTTALILSSLRDRGVSVLLAWALDLIVCAPFVCLGVTRLGTASAFTMLLAVLLYYVGAAAVRGVLDYASREGFRTDAELMVLHHQLQCDADELANLLENMVPNATFAKLFSKVRNPSNLRNSTAVHLATFPKQFGIRGSLFATRVEDVPILLIGFPTVAQPTATHTQLRSSLFACVKRALSVVVEVSVIKTDGDSMMLVDDRSRDPSEKSMSLLLVVARLTAEARSLCSGNDESAPRCVLASGPVIGGVLGTAALSFEYYGLPVLVAREIMHEMSSKHTTVATHRFTELIHWWAVHAAATHDCVKDAVLSSSMMSCGFEVMIEIPPADGPMLEPTCDDTAKLSFRNPQQWKLRGIAATQLIWAIQFMRATVGSPHPDRERQD